MSTTRVSHGSTRVERGENSVAARKACLNCRRQKMKCVVHGNSQSCRRCERSGLPCVFVPRANAASLPDHVLSHVGIGNDDFKNVVLDRLKAIEDYLGLSAADSAIEPAARAEDEDDQISPESAGSGPLWDAAATLKKNAPPSMPSSIWSKSTIENLWSCFPDRMPRLHFMPHKENFPAPPPVLLASILYCSSSRGPPDAVNMAPHYFTMICIAISQLCIPNSEIGTPSANPEEWAFQTVHGIVVAGLMMEANVLKTGIWISLAYRLILEYCPSHPEETTRDWRNLFNGIQIIDLEHAALHLSCPVIPLEPPLQTLKISRHDQLYRLSRMMHTGLTHFTGRRLPTIWSCFDQPVEAVVNRMSSSSFSAVDDAVIRDWARQLDDWLTEFSQRPDGSEQDCQLVFRQYVLHRLVVLSIYHPARGCDLWSMSTTPMEQHELLLSARSTLQLRLHDDSIWSNWDLIMITWAALIVIQGIQGGAGETYDLDNIRIHLEFLKQMNEPKPSLCDKLVVRLEESLGSTNEAASARLRQTAYNDLNSGYGIDQASQLFDPAILQQMIPPVYPAQEHMGLLQ